MGMIYNGTYNQDIQSGHIMVIACIGDNIMEEIPYFGGENVS